MNYYISYAIRCIIRRIIYFLTKPKYLLIILTIIIVFFLLSNYTTVFGWEGDNDYTDKNNTIALNYESIVNDFINRLNNVNHNNVNYNNLIFMLNNGEMSFYLYYGDSNGTSMTGANFFVTSNLNIIFYLKSNPKPSISTYERYNGMVTNMYNLTSSIQDYYYFENGILYTSTKPSTVVVPGVLISYISPSWVSFYNNDSQQQTNDILGALNQQTNTINQQTTVIQETQDFLEDHTIQDSSMNIDTTGMTVNDNGVNNFFTNFLNSVYNIFVNIDATVETITIPMPSNIPDIVLRSDIISSHVSNTILFTLIQTFWWFVISRYIIHFVFRMVKWLSDGELAERGVFAFADWLDSYNSIIKSYMM